MPLFKVDSYVQIGTRHWFQLVWAIIDCPLKQPLGGLNAVDSQFAWLFVTLLMGRDAYQPMVTLISTSLCISVGMDSIDWHWLVISPQNILCYIIITSTTVISLNEFVGSLNLNYHVSGNIYAWGRGVGCCKLSACGGVGGGCGVLQLFACHFNDHNKML